MASISWVGCFFACHLATLGADTIAERDDTKSRGVTADLLTKGLTPKGQGWHMPSLWLDRRKATSPYISKSWQPPPCSPLSSVGQDSSTLCFLPRLLFCILSLNAVAFHLHRKVMKDVRYPVAQTTSSNNLNLRRWLTGSWICFLQGCTPQALLNYGIFISPFKRYTWSLVFCSKRLDVLTGGTDSPCLQLHKWSCRHSCCVTLTPPAALKWFEEPKVSRTYISSCGPDHICPNKGILGGKALRKLMPLCQTSLSCHISYWSHLSSKRHHLFRGSVIDYKSDSIFANSIHLKRQP